MDFHTCTLQGQLILKQIRDRSPREIEANLRATFVEAESAIPLDMLANYLVRAQIARMQWWLEKRRPQASANLMQMLHRLHRAAMRDAFGLKEGE